MNSYGVTKFGIGFTSAKLTIDKWYIRNSDATGWICICTLIMASSYMCVFIYVPILTAFHILKIY